MGTAGNKITPRGTAALFAAALLGGVMASGAASATPFFTVDGIGLGYNNVLATTTIYEDLVTAPGQHISGIGFVDSIKDTASGIGCSGPGSICFQPSATRELTFTFDYFVEKIQATSPNTAIIWASGGTVNFYSDSTPNFTQSSGNQATDVASATDGSLWLHLVGAPTGLVCDATCVHNGAQITLAGTFDISGSDLTTVANGNGAGFLNVQSGTAAAWFDTNTQPSGQDIQLGTDFSKAGNASDTDFAIEGSADLNGCVQDPTGRVTTVCTPVRVPEPDSLLLFGTALASLAAGAFGRLRRRSRA